MGKSRRNRGGPNHRRDPTSKTINPPSDPELAALRESKILPVIKDLQSADPNSRSAAASAVSNIVQDPRCRKLLLREQIVHTILSQTVTDSALESRAAGWGILQILSQEEEADFCVHLYRTDVLTAIEFAAATVHEKIVSKDPTFSKTPTAEQAAILSIAASLISLLTALAEARDEILEKISGNPIIMKLIFVIISHGSQESHDGVQNLRTDALACLMILCEDNTLLSANIANENDSGCGQALTELKDTISGDGILACATLHNIFAALESFSQLSSADDTTIIPTLVKAIATFTPGQTSSEVTGWSNPSEYRQLALETIAAICTDLSSEVEAAAPPAEKKSRKPKLAGDEDMGDADEDVPVSDDDEELEDGEGEDDEMDDDEIEADMEMVTAADNDNEDSSTESLDDLPVLKSLLHTAFPEILRIACLQPADDETLALQGLALSALNNLSWSVSVIDFSHAANTGIQKVWAPIGRSIWQKVISPILSSDTADVALATQVTGLAWAIARTLHGQTPIQPGEHRKFISLYQATRGSPAMQDSRDPFQSLGVKCIGVLGQLALHPAPLDLNREIGTFLVTILTALPETPIAEAVEALGQIFEIYNDDDYDYDAKVFWKDGFLKHLEEVLPKARAMLKGVNKKEQPELRARADDAVRNHDRFLAYKRKHKPRE